MQPFRHDTPIFGSAPGRTTETPHWDLCQVRE
nr:MAG TPA: hypothetical protein [Caudoviricetes sp.]